MRDGFREESTSRNVKQLDDFAMLHITEFYDGHQTYVTSPATVSSSNI